MVDLHEYKGHRFNRYHELAQYAFGTKYSPDLFVPVKKLALRGFNYLAVHKVS